jgi:alanine dehydrogenase
VRVLTDADVRAALPGWPELVDLAAEALTALAEGRAEAPPKPAVHTSPGMFANAMPAAHPERNLLGCKWISIVPDNPVRGLPTANGLMLLSDGTTGVPSCVMPAGELTAVRTAAVTGATLRALADPSAPVTFLGTGRQAHSHLAMLAALGRDEVTVWGRRSSAVRALAEWAGERVPRLRVRAAVSREAAVRDAGTVVTGLAIGLTDTRLPTTWPQPEALLVPLDYASSVGPDLAETAVVAADDVRQFDVVRADRAKLGGYPRATHWTGHLLDGHRPRGRLVVANLGSGVSDLLVADGVARRAAALGLGQEVPL